MKKAKDTGVGWVVCRGNKHSIFYGFLPIISSDSLDSLFDFINYIVTMNVNF